jgi:hypothetical protein
MPEYGSFQRLQATATVDEMVARGVGAGGGGGTSDPATGTKQSTQIELETTIRDRTPVLGQATAANSTPVVLSSDGPFAVNFGLIADGAAGSDTASTSFVGLFKRLLQRVTVLINSVVQPATNRTTTTRVLTTALVEESIGLTNAKKISMHCRNNADVKFDTTLGNTINTPNFTTIRAGQEYSEIELNFTGTLYFSSESIPSSTVASCTTTSGSPTVTAGTGAFSGITLGQAVTGTGIAANTIVVARNAAGSSITLSQNATASGTVTLTFAGAVVRVESWS